MGNHPLGTFLADMHLADMRQVDTFAHFEFHVVVDNREEVSELHRTVSRMVEKDSGMVLVVAARAVAVVPRDNLTEVAAALHSYHLCPSAN